MSCSLHRHWKRWCFQHFAQLWPLSSNFFAPFIFNAIRVSSGSCSISWILKSGGNYYGFATTSSSSLVLLDFTPKALLLFSIGSSSSEVSWQETIWVDVIIPLSKNSGGKYSLKVIGVMSFFAKRSSTYIIFCFVFLFLFRISTNILLMLFIPRKIRVLGEILASCEVFFISPMSNLLRYMTLIHYQTRSE